MVRRTTILLDEEVYKKLVEESLKRYGTTKAISKVVNDLLKTALKNHEDILSLLLSEKVTKISIKEIEDFRRELSKRLES